MGLFSHGKSPEQYRSMSEDPAHQEFIKNSFRLLELDFSLRAKEILEETKQPMDSGSLIEIIYQEYHGIAKTESDAIVLRDCIAHAIHKSVADQKIGIAGDKLIAA